MKKKIIYAKKEEEISRVELTIYEDSLEKILNKLDKYYGLNFKEKQYYGAYIPELKKGDIVKSIKAEKIPSSEFEAVPYYKFTYEVSESNGVSKLVRQILNENNCFILSYKINELFNYDCKDETELQLLKYVLYCFRFKEKNKKLDFKKSLFNYDRKIYGESVNLMYVDDSQSYGKLDLPSSYILNIRP